MLILFLSTSRHTSPPSQQKWLIWKQLRCPLLGTLLVKLKTSWFSTLVCLFFFHVKKSFFSISLQALFDSLKNKFAYKNIFVCDLPFTLFIIRKFYNSKVIVLSSLKSVFLVLWYYLSFSTWDLKLLFFLVINFFSKKYFKSTQVHLKSPFYNFNYLYQHILYTELNWQPVF